MRADQQLTSCHQSLAAAACLMHWLYPNILPLCSTSPGVLSCLQVLGQCVDKGVHGPVCPYISSWNRQHCCNGMLCKSGHDLGSYDHCAAIWSLPDLGQQASVATLHVTIAKACLVKKEDFTGLSLAPQWTLHPYVVLLCTTAWISQHSSHNTSGT